MTSAGIFTLRLFFGCNGIKLVDFERANGNGNTYRIVTELTHKNGSDEFRPDITVIINGMPLAFLEVKKPNDLDVNNISTSI